MSHNTSVSGLLRHYWRQLAAVGVFALALLVIFLSVGAPNGSGPALAAPTEDLSTPGSIAMDETVEGEDSAEADADPVFTPSPLNTETFDDNFIYNPVNPNGPVDNGDGNDNGSPDPDGSNDGDNDGEVEGPQDPGTDNPGDGGDGDGPGTDGPGTDGPGTDNPGTGGQGPIGDTVDTVEDTVDEVVPGTGGVVDQVDDALDPVTDPVDEVLDEVIGNLPVTGGNNGGNNGGVGDVLNNVTAPVTGAVTPVLPGVKGLGQAEVVEDEVALPAPLMALFVINFF